MAKRKIVYIKWFDSYTINTVKTTEEVEKEPPYIMEDTGFLITESGNHITLATSCLMDGSWKHIHAIPKCNIIKKKIIRLS